MKIGLVVEVPEGISKCSSKAFRKEWADRTIQIALQYVTKQVYDKLGLEIDPRC